MYGAPSPKRQYAWSNSKAITKLNVGWKKMDPTKKIQTVEKYHDKKGVLRYKGTKALRSTESLCCILALRKCYAKRISRFRFVNFMIDG